MHIHLCLKHKQEVISSPFAEMSLLLRSYELCQPKKGSSRQLIRGSKGGQAWTQASLWATGNTDLSNLYPNQ